MHVRLVNDIVTLETFTIVYALTISGILSIIPCMIIMLGIVRAIFLSVGVCLLGIQRETFICQRRQERRVTRK